METAFAAARPFALQGWLPVWGVERRRAPFDEVVAWTLAQLRACGVEAAELSAIAVEGLHARELARRLTRESMAPALVIVSCKS